MIIITAAAINIEPLFASVVLIMIISFGFIGGFSMYLLYFKIKKPRKNGAFND
jgi:uncharacterized membrane-anchored protein